MAELAETVAGPINAETGKQSYFLAPCECELGKKLKRTPAIIKEATTGYLDPTSQQSVGNFITYVIEVEVLVGFHQP